MKRIVVALCLALTSGGAWADDLLQVYEMASANDPALRAARATRDAGLEAKAIARGRLLPLATLVGDASYNHRDFKGSQGASSNFGGFSFGGQEDEDFASGNIGLQVTQPIYRKDRLVESRQADDQVAQALADYATAEQDLILRVSQAYFEVLSTEATLTFTDADVKAIARQLDQATQRFEVGLIAITDVNEAQARYDQARADAIVAQNDVDDALESLAEITGTPIRELAGLVADAEFRRPDPDSLDDWTQLALQTNPGILSARYDVDIAKKEIQRQDAGDSPALDLVGSYNLSRTDSRNGTDLNDASIGVQLSFPLYTGGGVSAATRQARFQYEAAQEVLEQRRRQIQTQVRNAYRGVLASISRVKALEATEVSANSALEATEAGFEVGTRTLVDVLNSQRELFRAKRDLAISRYDYILNMLSLQQAAGTLGQDHVEMTNAWLQPDQPSEQGAKHEAG